VTVEGEAVGIGVGLVDGEEVDGAEVVGVPLVGDLVREKATPLIAALTGGDQPELLDLRKNSVTIFWDCVGVFYLFSFFFLGGCFIWASLTAADGAVSE
jgi:hypothetical protein